MKLYRADLHIHSVLSPCGDLEMSPSNIVSEASSKGLDIIGITDHNTTLHAKLVSRLAAKKGIFVLQGSEVTTKEEVHCLVFFENDETLELFQDFINQNLPEIPNNPSIFGYQVQVDENDQIIYEEKRLLFGALSKSIKELELFVHSLNGLFIPAHIDRKKNSIYSQLGFMPVNMIADALEISRASAPDKFTGNHPEIAGQTILRSSDAHIPEDIGAATTLFRVEKPDFDEIRQALHGINGREVLTS
jgi:3',5'-nucleoside bisphosphate phosphatase